MKKCKCFRSPHVSFTTVNLCKTSLVQFTQDAYAGISGIKTCYPSDVWCAAGLLLRFALTSAAHDAVLLCLPTFLLVFLHHGSKQPTIETLSMPNQSLLSFDSEDENALQRYVSEIEEEDVRLILNNRENGVNRLLKVPTSVILPKTGKKVKRSNLFFTSDVDSASDGSNSSEEDGSDHLEGRTAEATNGSLVEFLLQTKTKVLDITQSEVFQNVMKCSVAYLVASLAVYCAPLSRLFGHVDTKHIAASASIYFHPGKTKGAMHQLFLFALLSLLFSFSLSLISRTISSFLYNRGTIGWSYFVDLMFSSIGLGIVAYWKQKVDMDSFSTACHLAYISIIAGIVKEGSLNADRSPLPRLFALGKIVLFGSFVAVTACYTLWPRSATHLLRSSLNHSFNDMSSLLSILSHRFLNGEKVTEKDLRIFVMLRERTTHLQVYLKEAQFELRFMGKEAEYDLYCEIVEATCSLEEHLQGLKSSCEMQWQLLLANEFLLQEGLGEMEQTTQNLNRRFSRGVAEQFSTPMSADFEATEYDFDAVYSTQLFDLFAYYLAPSVKSFVFTVKEILRVLPFEETGADGKGKRSFVKSTEYQASLNKAIKVYEEKQVRTFNSLYSQKIFQAETFSFRSDQEEVAACCGNFSALLSSYGQELIHFLQLTSTFEQTVESNRRSWSFLTNWDFSKLKFGKSESDSTLVDALQEITAKSKHRNLIHHHDFISETTELIPKKTRIDNVSMYIWRRLKFFRNSNVQFGIRTAIGAFCISIFAFIPATRQKFVSFRSEWALIIYCIMMSKSLGGTTMPAKWRFMGTFQGAFLAFLIWHISNANPIALALTGFLLSIPCFYILLSWKDNHAYGRFILLTYNLTALYTYMELDTLGDNDKRPIVWEIAFHRFVAVSFGILWALFITAILLPNSARAQLKLGLTILWLRMGVIWSSNPMDSHIIEKVHGNGDNREIALVGLRDLAGTRELLMECRSLLKLAPNEIRLKGRFPRRIFKQLLKSTSVILDAFLNLQIIVEMDKKPLSNELYVLLYIEEERNELEHRIFLIFYMIASAMALGFPLPSKPASTEHAKNRLLLKLSEFRSESRQRQIQLQNRDYCRLYSYILVTSIITNELDIILECNSILLGNITEDAFKLV